MGTNALHTEIIEAALEKVLASRPFRRADGARRFLEYVVRETLAGRGPGLKEYTIGVVVCRRGPDFDPRIDTIVRVAAIKLRQRLLAYYRTEGAVDPVVISIPKGGYRPVFQAHEEPPVPILDDPEALYWQALALFRQFSPEAFERVRRLLMHGVARWPDDARLHLLLARVVAVMTCSFFQFMDPDEGVPLMQWAARRALTLDPGQAGAQLYLDIPSLRRDDKSAVLAAARRALVLSPQDPDLHHWAAAILLSAGKASEALLHMRLAVRLRPEALNLRTFTASVLLYDGKPEDSIRCLRDVLQFEPGDYAANYWLSRAYCAHGDYDQARDIAVRAYKSSGTARALATLGQMEAFTGNSAAVASILSLLDQKRAENIYVPRSSVATIYIGSGNLDAAAAEAEAAAHEGDFRLGWIQGDPLWKPLIGRVAGL